MTHPQQPPHDNDPLDELASAHLDGVTTPAEAAQVGADPGLAHRLERLAAVRDALRASAPASVDATQRDAAIAAALAAFDEADDLAASTTTTAVPLAHPHRARPRRRTLQLVGIAAAAVLLALTVPVLDRIGSDRRDDTASSSFDATGSSLAPSAEEGAASGAGGGTAGGAKDQASNLDAFEAAGAPDLGPFAELDALQAAVRGQLGTAARPTTTAAGADSPDRTTTATSCTPSGEGAVVYVARATLSTQPVTVVVREDPAGGRTLLVLDAGCAVLSEGPL